MKCSRFVFFDLKHTQKNPLNYGMAITLTERGSLFHSARVVRQTAMACLSSSNNFTTLYFSARLAADCCLVNQLPCSIEVSSFEPIPSSRVIRGQCSNLVWQQLTQRILQKLFQTGKKRFSDQVTYNLAIKIIDVLEYIHSKGYAHNDIKAQNLLLGYGRTKENDVYLVDFGLVSKYQRDGVHNEYKPDARKAHDGK